MSSLVAALIASDPNWLQRLQDDYAISVVRDGDLVSLKYNQIESPMHEPIVQECRGMVVDTARNFIMAWPYNKFWNHGDMLAAEIDWSTARVLEKLDGSLMTMYWDDRPGIDAWAVASSGTPRAGGNFGDNEHETFRDAFWRTFTALGMDLPEGSAISFMFEFCDAPNRIIVRHDAPRIVLHGARNARTGREFDRWELEAVAKENRWELVKSYPITSVADCLAAADALNPIKCEGFIVVDAAFNRIKIKSPRYVMLHHMKGEATPRRAIELWQTGETEETLTYFPEFAPKILPVQERLDRLAEDAAIAVNLSMGMGVTRKEFASTVKQMAYAPVAFKLFGAKVHPDDARAVMRKQTTQALERMLEVQP